MAHYIQYQLGHDVGTVYYRSLPCAPAGKHDKKKMRGSFTREIDVIKNMTGKIKRVSGLGVQHGEYFSSDVWQFFSQNNEDICLLLTFKHYLFASH